MKNYFVNQMFLDVLDTYICSAQVSDKYVCEQINKNRSWLSHLRKGKINSISSTMCEEIAKVLSLKSNLSEAERIEWQNKISLDLHTALSKSNTLSDSLYVVLYEKKYGKPYEDNYIKPRIFENREFLYDLIETLKGMNYPPSAFIKEIVKSRKAVLIIDYDDGPFEVSTQDCPDDYLDDVVSNEQWETTFRAMSVILYCFLELLYIRSPQLFVEKYGEAPKKNKEAYLRKKTKEILLQNEKYFTLEEFKNFFNEEEDDDEDDWDIMTIASALPEDTPARLSILQILTALNDLNQYQSDLDKDRESSFIETVQQNLCCESYDFVLGIYGNDYLKIKGALKRNQFVKELQQLIAKYIGE